MIALAAMSDNRVIGNKMGIPWKLKADMQWFKKFTMGKRILVGRKTYDTLPKLPGREVWVLTRGSVPETEWLHQVVRDVNDIPNDIIVAGGAKVYEELLPHCDEFYLTVVEGHYSGDAFMCPFEHLFKAYEIVQSGEGYEIRRYYKVNPEFPQTNC